MTKHIIGLTLLTLLLLGGVFLKAQDCTVHINEDKVIGGTHILRSHQKTLVVRGNYSYSVMLSSDEKGITALMISNGGIEFNQDDEVIFMDANKTRRSYRFVGMGEVNTERGVPIHSNVLQLDVAALNWFSSNVITTLYLKNNISNEMRKFTLTSTRLNDFNTMATCFYQVLDPSKIVDRGDAGLLIPSGPSSTRTTSAASQGNGVSQTPAAVNPGSDQELDALRRELTETKTRLRKEIADERSKADRLKSNLQTEVAAAQEQAAIQKKAFADEVLFARKQSQEAIIAAREASSQVVQDARSNADDKVISINKEVIASREKAQEKVQAAQLESAEAIKAARDKAAKELESIRNRLDEAKTAYSDEVASARENSSTELQRIREETAQEIQSARKQASNEQSRTARLKTQL